MNKNRKKDDHPGLRCQFVRHWEAWRGPVTGHTSLTARHLQTCAECQAFFAEDFSFEGQLRSAARVEKAATTATLGFEQRILRAVRESRPEQEPREKRIRVTSLAWSLAGAVAGIALVFVVVQQMVPDKTSPEVASVPHTDERTETPAAAAESPLRWLRSLDARESAIELAANNPLEQEIKSISANAQSVIGFLALNFLPTKPAETPAGEPGPVKTTGQG